MDNLTKKTIDFSKKYVSIGFPCIMHHRYEYNFQTSPVSQLNIESTEIIKLLILGYLKHRHVATLNQ